MGINTYHSSSEKFQEYQEDPFIKVNNARIF